MIHINGYTFYRAHLLALGDIKVTHALGTSVRIDFVNRLTLVDCLVGAGRFTDIAVDAIIGNYQRHSNYRGGAASGGACVQA